MSLRLLGSMAFLGGMLLLGFSTAADANREPAVGKAIRGFTLKDTHGKAVSLNDFQDRKALVVVFLGTECPVNNAYQPYLGELARRYKDKGVQFVGVNSNHQDTPERITEHAKRYDISFPVLRDEDRGLADEFGAERTPEAFVLDQARVIRYRGRIDDQFGITYRRPGKPTRNDLTEALDEVLSGKPVAVPTTSVAGCLIPKPLTAKAGAPVTYAKDISRLIQKHCQECHRPGQIGPFALSNYDAARDWSGMIREVLSDGRMPPWHADPRYGKYANDRRISDADKNRFLAWIDAGCPRGDDKDLPPPRQFHETWSIGKPDLVFTMKDEFSVPASGGKNGIEYQYFYVDTNFKEDRWVTAAEARPGNNAIVHHIVVFIVPPGLKFIPQLGNAPVLCGTAPGDMPLLLPPGMAKKVPAGSQLVFQMHYTPNGLAQTDRSSVGIVLAKEMPERRVNTFPIAVPPPALRIPAGADNHPVESWFTFKSDAYALNWMPHMHLRGKDFLVEAIYPDGSKETLLSIPRYDFNWQSVYRYAEPKKMPAGTKIHCVAHFDNSAKNPNNPDPTKIVRWGDQTWEEMMIGWMDYYNDRKAE